MKITNKKIKDLIFAEYNPRKLTTDEYQNLKENDVILCVGAAGGTETVDLLVVSSATGATTVTTTNGT